jgi:hypothetical protein
MGKSLVGVRRILSILGGLVGLLGLSVASRTMTLLVKSKPVRKEPCIRRLKARETRAIPQVTRTPMTLERDCRDLPSRVFTDFILVGVTE